MNPIMVESMQSSTLLTYMHKEIEYNSSGWNIDRWQFKINPFRSSQINTETRTNRQSATFSHNEFI